MKFTKLALKKLALILPGYREKQEAKFLWHYIIACAPPLNWNHGLNRREAQEYCRRCNEFDVEILGIEISQDSPYPINVFAFEDYKMEKYSWSWIRMPLEELETIGIDSFIVPVVNVPDEILTNYLSE